MAAIVIRRLEAQHRQWAANLLREAWGSTKIVTRGKIYDAAALPGFVAFAPEDEPVGLATYRLDGDECELMTLNSLAEGRGAGTALIDAVRSFAQDAGCCRLWLITTNDNTRALRFYQRRGFVLAALHRNALEASRQLKPEIPPLGMDGIPLRDEIELEMSLC